jgi:hypothetical protein
MVIAILESMFIGSLILIVGAIVLSIINFYIQKKRAKYYYKQGYISSIDSGFCIKKDKDGKLKINANEKYFILF